jgi:hypothetical protein
MSAGIVYLNFNVLTLCFWIHISFLQDSYFWLEAYLYRRQPPASCGDSPGCLYIEQIPHRSVSNVSGRQK